MVFLWWTTIYATAAGVLIDLGENTRFRFEMGPLPLVASTVVAVAIWRGFRTGHRRSAVPPERAATWAHRCDTPARGCLPQPNCGQQLPAARCPIHRWLATDTDRPTFVTPPATLVGGGQSEPSVGAGPVRRAGGIRPGYEMTVHRQGGVRIYTRQAALSG